MASKLRRCIGVLLCVSSLLLGCRPDEPSEAASQLVIPLPTDIQTLDPAQLSDPYTSRIIWQVYEGLVGLTVDGEAVPVLARNWSSDPTAKQWTFHIREGVRFHPDEAFGAAGTREVTAQDVRYSFERFAKGFGSFVFSGIVKGFDSYIRGEADNITGFVVLNSATFQVILERPDPAFIHRITSPYLSIMPVEAIEFHKEDFGRTVAVGTGPFILERASPTEVTLRRNDSYWRQEPGNVERVTFRVEKNEQLRLSQFLNGTYDILEVPSAQISRFYDGPKLRLKWRDDYRSYVVSTFNVHYMGFDIRQVQDAHLRRGIALGIEKEAIVGSLLLGFGKVAEGPVPPGLQGYHPPPGLSHNRRKARDEVSRSNYDGRSLRLLTSNAPNHLEAAQIIQAQLKSIGVAVQIDRVDLNTLISRLFSQNRPELFMAFSEWIFSAPELILASFDSEAFPNPNVTGYKNDQVDSLLRDLQSLRSREAINELCQKVSRLAADDAPAVWLFHEQQPLLLRSEIHSFAINGHQHWLLGRVELRK